MLQVVKNALKLLLVPKAKEEKFPLKNQLESENVLLNCGVGPNARDF